MDIKKRVIAGLLAAGTAISVAGCTQNNNGAETTTTAVNNSGAETTASNEAASGEKLTLKVLTHRTDRIEDGSLDAMTDAFEAANNCVVEYQGFTDYATDVPTMMNTTEYGDVLMIPDTVKLEDLSNFFEPLGSYDEMNGKYNWADKKMSDKMWAGKRALHCGRNLRCRRFSWNRQNKHYLR